MDIGQVATLVAGIAGAISAIIAAVALIGIQRQTEAALFVTINEEWSNLYFAYREVLLAEAPLAELERIGDVDVFINTSDAYRKLHPVISFYEFLGSCMQARLISPRLLFRLVSVNPKLWLRYKPLIEKMREMGATGVCTEWQALSELRMRTIV